MNPIEHELEQASSPAPLRAAIEREIQERCDALEELETAWLDALLARSFTLARWLADCSKEHCREIALARAELQRYPEEAESG
jgi:hypothetical protein